ncbi:hypothetical protein CTEN210_14524 [Chaetoceros tenuissimus]|uniref:Calcineurin-like phosphoesterase domain-containing protein n=1 Tax=Chaetoceros tenuissimus TaxID=426638 RepID=A0AAD3D5D4_9STRA|nr:hypothetical protein CTEN210_14524 [Chaetoceros tenuissimus]
MRLIGLFVSLLAARSTKRKTSKFVKKEQDRLSIHNTRLKWATETDAVVLIDLENVRGKSNFDLTHQELLRQTTQWVQMNELEDKVTFVVDHGSLHTAYYLQEEKLSLVFAGPRMKADDVLARDIAFFEKNAIVVTADNELMSRCRNAMSNSEHDIEVAFIQPIKFISDLKALDDKLARKRLEAEESNDNPSDTETASSSDDDDDEISQELANKIEEEIKIRGAMYETEVQMRTKRNMNTPKKRRKLEKRARMLCERLAMKGGQKLDHLTAINGVSDYDKKFQDEVLSQWQKLRKNATRREMTGDRILLAEHFRRQIENVAIEEESKEEQSDTEMNHSLRYVQHIQNMLGNNVATSMGSGDIKQIGDDSGSEGGNGPVRLVIVSDTHGYEESLTPKGGILPRGDILLHLGDFAIDSSVKKQRSAIERFDGWLARQPHRTKIVLRGNHDPFSVQFPISGANFFSRPKSIAIDGKLTITLVPYSSPRNLSSSWRKLPMFCDILATHSPPHRILDKCYNGANAGCSAIRGKVERMIAGPPYLWLCGHIHEGRGAEKHAFGLSPRETLVVNGANANEGRATHIEAGPIVLDIDTEGNIKYVEGDEAMTKQMEKLGVESAANTEVEVVA